MTRVYGSDTSDPGCTRLTSSRKADSVQQQTPIVVDAILSRRSIRFGFTEDEVPRAVLEIVARCGLAAPSSKNAQPWRLHVVTDRAALQAVAADVAAAPDADRYVPHDPRTGLPAPRFTSTVRESAEVLTIVPAAIFVENGGDFSGGIDRLANAGPEARRAALAGYTFEVLGVGAAVENMWLAANALGLGAAFMGDILIAEAAIRRRLDVSGDLVGVLALGYREAGLGPPPRPMDDPADAVRLCWHPPAGAGPREADGAGSAAE